MLTYYFILYEDMHLWPFSQEISCKNSKTKCLWKGTLVFRIHHTVFVGTYENLNLEKGGVLTKQ